MYIKIILLACLSCLGFMSSAQAAVENSCECHGLVEIPGGLPAGSQGRNAAIAACVCKDETATVFEPTACPAGTMQHGKLEKKRCLHTNTAPCRGVTIDGQSVTQCFVDCEVVRTCVTATGN